MDIKVAHVGTDFHVAWNGTSVKVLSEALTGKEEDTEARLIDAFTRAYQHLPVDAEEGQIEAANMSAYRQYQRARFAAGAPPTQIAS